MVCVLFFLKKEITCIFLGEITRYSTHCFGNLQLPPPTGPPLSSLFFQVKFYGEVLLRALASAPSSPLLEKVWNQLAKRGNFFYTLYTLSYCYLTLGRLGRLYFAAEHWCCTPMWNLCASATRMGKALMGGIVSAWPQTEQILQWRKSASSEVCPATPRKAGDLTAVVQRLVRFVGKKGDTWAAGSTCKTKTNTPKNKQLVLNLYTTELKYSTFCQMLEDLSLAFSINQVDQLKGFL